MSFLVAPSAFRKPISLVRSITETSIIFIIPIPPTTKDIADVVKKAGYDIDKKKINLDEHIKALGRFQIDVKLYEGVNATLNIQVVEADN